MRVFIMLFWIVMIFYRYYTHTDYVNTNFSGALDTTYLYRVPANSFFLFVHILHIMYFVSLFLFFSVFFLRDQSLCDEDSRRLILLIMLVEIIIVFFFRDL